MLIKRNSRCGGGTDITRRFAISGMAAGLAGAMLESPLRGQKRQPAAGKKAVADQNKVVTSTPLTNVWAADMNGNPSGGKLGIVLACPQSCAAVRPGYADASQVYLKTSEWMREIIFTADDLTGGSGKQTDADQNWRHYRRLLGFYRVSNDAYTTGCGHISRNVTVVQVAMQAAGNLKETLLGVNYSSLVFDGATDSSGQHYQATDIYIFQGDWAPLSASTPNLKTVVDQIGTDDRPIDVSACPS